MKKSIACMLVFLLFVSTAFSQHTKEKGWLDVSIGPSFPIGKFGNTDLNNSSSGFATTGAALNISYSHIMKGHWGVSVALHGQLNPLNTAALEKDFGEAKFYLGFGVYPIPGPPPPITYTSYPNWNFDRNSWLSTSLLVGGYGQFGSAQPKQLAYTVRLMMGAIYVVSPELNGQSKTDTSSAHVTQSKASAIGFAYLAGAGMRYHLNKRVFLILNLEYIGTNNIKFKDIRTTITTTHGVVGSPGFSVSQAQFTGEARQKISSLNLLAGIGLQL